MVRVCRGAGVVLRPNSSLAGVLASSGLASGGNGSGLRLPLSCDLAVSPAKNAMAHNARAARHAEPRQVARVADLMLDDMLNSGSGALESNQSLGHDVRFSWTFHHDLVCVLRTDCELLTSNEQSAGGSLNSTRLPFAAAYVK